MGLKRAEGQMSPCTFLAKIKKVGLFDKEGGKLEKKKKRFTLSNECYGEILLSMGSQSRDDLGKEWSQRLPLFSFPSLQSTTHEPSLEEGVGT